MWRGNTITYTEDRMDGHYYLRALNKLKLCRTSTKGKEKREKKEERTRKTEEKIDRRARH